MEYTEPDHLQLIRRTIRNFLDNELPRPLVRKFDKARHFPKEIFKKLADLGFCGLTIDEEYGGAGRDIVAATIVIEELCKRSTTLAGPYIHCAFYGGINISEKGTESQKRNLLPQIASGDILFAYGLTEPDVGSDLADVRTRGTLSKDGKSITVNGVKSWCTAVGISQYIYCLIKTGENSERYKNLSFVLIPTNAKGVRINPIDHTGLGYAETCEVVLDSVEIPLENVVGGLDGWNSGWPMLVGPALDVEKLEVAAMALGIATAAIDDATRYAKERTQFGKPICKHQAIANALVDAYTKLAACRHMLYHAAALAQQNRACSIETSMAKLFITESAVEIVRECQKIFGAYGFAEEYDMARYMRDVLVLPIIGGSTNIQKNNLSKRLQIV